MRELKQAVQETESASAVEPVLVTVTVCYDMCLQTISIHSQADV